MGRFRGGVAAILVGAGIAGAALTLPGGGGSDCAWPTCFPDAANTGVPSGTSLTAYGGSLTLAADQVIDGKTVSGCLIIDPDTATNVTIRNSRVTCTGGGWAVDTSDDDGGVRNGTPNLVIEDSELICSTASGGTGITGGDFTLTRVEIRGCENGCSVTRDVIVEDSYIHDLNNGGGDPHEDGCQHSGSHNNGGASTPGVDNITYDHNRIEGVAEDDAPGTSAIISNPTGGGAIDTDVLIEHNYLLGGGTVVYCPRPGSGSNYRVVNNTIDDNGGTGMDDCDDEAGTSGNVDPDGDPYTL